MGSYDDDSEMVPTRRDDTGKPADKNGWSASGTLSAGGNKTVALQAVFEKVPDTYTLQFTMLRPKPQASPPGVVRAEALITWSVEGNSVQRRVTIGTGTAVTGVAQGVKVTIKDTSKLIGAGPFNEDYNVSVQVTKGARGTGVTPPVLLPTDDVPLSPGVVPAQNGVQAIDLGPLGGNGSQAIWQVPKDAGVVAVKFLVFVNALGVATAPGKAVVSHDEGGVALCSYDPVIEDWVPVIPGTEQVVIVNTDNANHLLVQIIWGIEG